MPWLEGIHIRNYRVLKDLALGRNIERPYSGEPLPRLLTVIGTNGSGKSMFMDSFCFIRDCLREGVEEACDKPYRGGFERLRAQGARGPVEFEIYYRQGVRFRPVSYTLKIALDRKKRPFVAYERLRQRKKGDRAGQPQSFLEVENGEGHVWSGEAEKTGRKVPVRLKDSRRLAVATLGNLAEHGRIAAFREFLDGWYFSDFVPAEARRLAAPGAQKHLSRRGGNLANYVQYMERHYPEKFKKILRNVARKMPGVQKIASRRSDDGRLMLQFWEKGLAEPFYALDMSYGTLKMFAYLMLLEDPDPAPFIGIEEPEKGLHHQLLEDLAREMQKYAEQGGSQIMLTTHSPYLVDALTPKEVWILEKGDDGFSTVQRAADIEPVDRLYKEGIPMGSLWYSDHFGRGNP